MKRKLTKGEREAKANLRKIEKKLQALHLEILDARNREAGMFQ